MNLPSQRPAIFPTPSMRSASRWGNGPSEQIYPGSSVIPPGGINMEYLIRRSLEEEELAREDGEESRVDKLADRIARGRSLVGGPRMLKRHDTA